MKFHQHTNVDGEVLVLRRIPKIRITNGDGKGPDFHWPSGVGSKVECSDWNPAAICGGGLHGWPWGVGLGEGSDYDVIEDIWLVIGCKPEDVVGELDGGLKCKLRNGTIRLEGSFAAAYGFVQSGYRDCLATCAEHGSGQSATGYGSGQSATGDWSGQSATGGWSGQSATGYGSGQSATGDGSRQTNLGQSSASLQTRLGGRVRVGKHGAFLLPYQHADGTIRYRAGIEGENITAGVWYHIVNREIVVCEDQDAKAMVEAATR